MKPSSETADGAAINGLITILDALKDQYSVLPSYKGLVEARDVPTLRWFAANVDVPFLPFLLEEALGDSERLAFLVEDRGTPITQNVFELSFKHPMAVTNYLLEHGGGDVEISQRSLDVSIAHNNMDGFLWQLSSLEEARKREEEEEEEDVRRDSKRLRPSVISIEKACKKGHLAMVDLAFDTFPLAGRALSALPNAVISGNVGLVHSLLERGLAIESRSLPNLAAEHGCLGVLLYFWEREDLGLEVTFEGFDLACKNGHLDVVKFLREGVVDPAVLAAMREERQRYSSSSSSSLGGKDSKRDLDYDENDDTASTLSSLQNPIWADYGTTEAIDLAAAQGHLEVVRYLHEHPPHQPGQHDEDMRFATTNAMDDAAQNGHLEVVRCLHEHRTEGCTERAINLAAREGHYEVVAWLLAHRSEGFTHLALDGAAG